MRVTMLGCGSSIGVPVIGCDCQVCTSTNPKNKRTRVSIFIEINGVNLLIDTSPDLRQQALRHNIRKIDAVLYTHDHADHTNGLDDLRSFNMITGEAIQVYGDAATLELIKQRFPYAFLPMAEKIWYRPYIIANELPVAPIHNFEISGISITLFEQLHGKVKTLGYRIGNFAYSTDTDGLDESAFAALQGVDVWIVDCLRYTKSYTHSHLERTLGWIDRVKPRLSILTHMAHEFDYDTLASELPKKIVPGYDGLVIEI